MIHVMAMYELYILSCTFTEQHTTGREGMKLNWCLLLEVHFRLMSSSQDKSEL